MTADLRAVMDDARASVGASRRHLQQHVGEPRLRRRSQAVAAQKPAQEIARSGRWQRDEAAAIEARREDGRLRIVGGQRVEQFARLGLVLRRAHKRCRVARKVRGQPRCDVVAQQVAFVVDVGVALVLDPRDAALGSVGCEDDARQVEQRTPQRR